MLWSNFVVAEKFPEELKLKALGLGSKKITQNFLCVGDNEDKTKIKFGIKEFNTSEGKVYLRLSYDMDEKLYYLPINPLIRYEKLKHHKFKKNEVFVGYNILGEMEGEYTFVWYLFVKANYKDTPSFYIEDLYTLDDKEYEYFSKLREMTWLEHSEAEEIYEDKSKLENFIKILLKENSVFDTLITLDFEFSNSLNLMDVTKFDSKKREHKYTSMMRKIGIPRTVYWCKK